MFTNFPKSTPRDCLWKNIIFKLCKKICGSNDENFMHDSNNIPWKAPQNKGRWWYGVKNVTFQKAKILCVADFINICQAMGTTTIELYRKQSLQNCLALLAVKSSLVNSFISKISLKQILRTWNHILRSILNTYTINTLIIQNVSI